ncbi:MAG: DUF2442 domain-containing protein [Ardenticatenales bacterium]|nr:DUF2442 domain-containing protein [Ardenticatenales bacterium]
MPGTSLTLIAPPPRVVKVMVTDNTLTVDLEDGRSISVPLGWFPRLAHGTRVLDSGVFGVEASAGPHMVVDPAKASTPITICGFRQTRAG